MWHLQLILFFFAALAWSHTVAGNSPVLNVALLGGSIGAYDPNGPYGDYFASLDQAVLATKAFYPGVAPGYRTYDWYIRKLNDAGGIPTHDVNGTRIALHYRIFNIDFSLDATAMYQQHVTLASRLVSGYYDGRVYQVIIHMFTPIPAVFANVCDQTDKCIFMYTYAPPPAQFVCSDEMVRTLHLTGDTSCQGKRSGYRRFQNQFCPLSSYTTFGDPQLERWFSMGARRLAFISSNLPINQQMLRQSRITASDLGLTVVFDRTITKDDPAWTDADADQLAAYFRDADLDGLMYYSIEAAEPQAMQPNLQKLLEAFRRIDWLPKGISAFTITGASLPPDLARYVWQTFTFDARQRGANFKPINTSSNLEIFGSNAGDAVIRPAPQLYAEALNREMPDLNSFVFGAAVVIGSIVIPQKFIEVSGTIDVAQWREVARTLSIPSLIGLLQFDAYGQRVSIDTDIVLAQFVYAADGSLEYRTVAPDSIGLPAVYPMPTWSERTYTQTQYSTPGEKAVLTLTATVIVLAAACVAATVRYWGSPEVKAATPWFLILFSTGATVMLSSNFALSVDPTDAACAAQVWCFTCGFTMMFGALFLKTLRVTLIFNQTRIKLLKIPTWKISVALAGLVLIDVILNSAWYGTTGMRAKYIAVDPFRPARDYHLCVRDEADNQFLVLSIAFKAMLILFGLVLAWFSRNVDAEFNESRYLVVAIYLFSIVSALFVAIVGSGITSNHSSVVLQGVGVVIVTLTSLLLIFVPKFSDLIKYFDCGMGIRDFDVSGLQYSSTIDPRSAAANRGPHLPSFGKGGAGASGHGQHLQVTPPVSGNPAKAGVSPGGSKTAKPKPVPNGLRGARAWPENGSRSTSPPPLTIDELLEHVLNPQRFPTVEEYRHAMLRVSIHIDQERSRLEVATRTYAAQASSSPLSSAPLRSGQASPETPSPHPLAAGTATAGNSAGAGPGVAALQ